MPHTETSYSLAAHSLKMTPLTEHCKSGELEIDGDVIYVVELSSMRREHVDPWLKLSGSIRETWEPEKPLLVLCDMSQADFAFTPYITQSGAKMMKIQANLITTYIAWIIQDSIMGQLLSSVIQMGSGRGGAYYFVAPDKDQCFKWLLNRRQIFYENGNKDRRA
jgi:hypothetical protein